MGSKMKSNPWKFELQGWFGAPGRPSWRQDGAKLPNLAPRWAQDDHLRSQSDQLETILGGILPTFWDLGGEKPDSQKPSKTLGF